MLIFFSFFQVTPVPSQAKSTQTTELKSDSEVESGEISKTLDFLEEIHKLEKKMNEKFAGTVGNIEKDYRKDLKAIEERIERLEKKFESEKKPLTLEDADKRFRNMNDKYLDVERRFYEVRDQLTDVKRNIAKRSLMFTGKSVPLNCPRDDLLPKMIKLIEHHYKVNVSPKEIGQVCCINSSLYLSESVTNDIFSH